MARDSRSGMNLLTQEAVLTSVFERLRPRLLAMIARRVSAKLAARIDPEGVVQEAWVRARPRWLALEPKPADLDAWVYGQVLDRLIERIRVALGKERDADREVPWPDTAAGPLVDYLVDSQTGPTSALSRAERCEIVRAAMDQLAPIDREVVALRYSDGLSFSQIGAILHLEENTANVRALRALRKLRKLIPHAFRPPGASRP